MSKFFKVKVTSVKTYCVEVADNETSYHAASKVGAHCLIEEGDLVECIELHPASVDSCKATADEVFTHD